MRTCYCWFFGVVYFLVGRGSLGMKLSGRNRLWGDLCCDGGLMLSWFHAGTFRLGIGNLSEWRQPWNFAMCEGHCSLRVTRFNPKFYCIRSLSICLCISRSGEGYLHSFATDDRTLGIFGVVKRPFSWKFLQQFWGRNSFKSNISLVFMVWRTTRHIVICLFFGPNNFIIRMS